MKKSLDLLDQIILEAKRIDLNNKREAIARHKASQSIGESWLVNHLTSLKELIILENADGRDNRLKKKKE
tara:strand:- start:1754 stop:1963 length:210 start_codon:yes stop_codon:yes gene_type:complete